MRDECEESAARRPDAKVGQPDGLCPRARLLPLKLAEPGFQHNALARRAGLRARVRTCLRARRLTDHAAVFSGYRQRSAMRQRGHSGLRALQV